MERLSKTYCIEHLGIDPSSFDRPIRVAQFGTGVLLRGLIDFIFQKANDNGYFTGQIAMIRSTSSDISEFVDQDGIYTVVETGLNEQQEIQIHSTVVHCVSEVWSVMEDGNHLKNLFASPKLQLVISNTTEIGLAYQEEFIREGSPVSFPARLTALLYHRFQVLGSSQDSGLMIIPTELLIDNGQLLKKLVIQHADFNQLPSSFIQWLNETCDFCDSLVDRIVPGKLKAGRDSFKLPYIDTLAIQTEPYFLWAIQTNPNSGTILNFADKIPGMIITNDIQSYREQKLRLLNGGHTILSPLAYLLGCKTVEQMMQHEQLNQFLNQVCETEIIPSLELIAPQANVFYRQMKNRWLNPFIEHPLKNILAQTTTKMQIRNGDSFTRYFEANQELPVYLSFGFAAYLFLFKPHTTRNNQYFTSDLQGNEFEIADNKAELLYQHWMPYFSGEKTIVEIIPTLLSDTRIFDHPFIVLPGFKEKITQWVQSFQDSGLLRPLLTVLNTVPLNV